MAPRLRRMKTYRPRKRRLTTKEAPTGLVLSKQALYDLKHKLNAKVGTYLVLLEEGANHSRQEALQAARGEFLKYSGEMSKTAESLGERFSSAVREYLDSVDVLLHAQQTELDRAKIQRCRQCAERLEQLLQIAA